jgi:peptide/nickel transport system ATP-binding protein
MNEAPVIAINNLVKHFPVRGGWFAGKAGSVKAVDGIGFEIPPGRTFGLVGESGCGKSTLAMLLVKLLEPSVYQQNPPDDAKTHLPPAPRKAS